MLATVAAADRASTVRKKYSVFMYSEAEPYAMFALYKQTSTLCVLQYIFYDTQVQPSVFVAEFFLRMTRKISQAHHDPVGAKNVLPIFLDHELEVQKIF